jgi:CHAD domain-containing protein
MRKAERRFARSGRAGPLHEWRKRAKYLWYQLRLLRPHLRRRARPLPGQLRLLTELQGRANDLELVRRELAGRRTALGDHLPVLRKLVEKKQTQLLPRIRRAARKVNRCLPENLLRA